MPDDPLAREIRQLRDDIREDLADIKRGLDQRLPRELYDAHRAALEHRVGEVERDLVQLGDAVQAAETARTGQRRWMIGTLIGAGSIVVTIVLAVWVR